MMTLGARSTDSLCAVVQWFGLGLHFQGHENMIFLQKLRFLGKPQKSCTRWDGVRLGCSEDCAKYYARVT